MVYRLFKKGGKEGFSVRIRDKEKLQQQFGLKLGNLNEKLNNFYLIVKITGISLMIGILINEKRMKRMKRYCFPAATTATV